MLTKGLNNAAAAGAHAEWLIDRARVRHIRSSPAGPMQTRITSVEIKILLRIMCALKVSCRVRLQNIGKLCSDLLRQNVCGKCNNLKRGYNCSIILPPETYAIAKYTLS